MLTIKAIEKIQPNYTEVSFIDKSKQKIVKKKISNDKIVYKALRNLTKVLILQRNNYINFINNRAYDRIQYVKVDKWVENKELANFLGYAEDHLIYKTLQDQKDILLIQIKENLINIKKLLKFDLVSNITIEELYGHLNHKNDVKIVFHYYTDHKRKNTNKKIMFVRNNKIEIYAEKFIQAFSIIPSKFKKPKNKKYKNIMPYLQKEFDKFQKYKNIMEYIQEEFDKFQKQNRIAY